MPGGTLRVHLQKSNGLALFTDGSAYYKDGSGGWAWVALDAFDTEEFDFGAASGTTNSRMEMTAWIRGLEWLYSSLGPCEILVYSDSEYVGKGAMDRTRNRRKNQDLWYDLDEVIDNHKYIEFVWVKAHKDSKYNHFCDKLAGKARRNVLNT
jgi:ribonuclease HI